MRSDKTNKSPNKKKGFQKKTRTGNIPDKKKKTAALPNLAAKNEDGSIRLNRYLSNAGICSRREADVLIQTGVVTVNGKVVTELGIRVFPGDNIQYDGETINRDKMRYVLLNKPKNYVSNVDDPEKKQSALFLVRNACKEHIFPVGKLDRNTTGLLLFTNDADLAKRLIHPTHEVRKLYHVTLVEKVNPAHLKQIKEGIELEDGMVAADKVEFVSAGKSGHEIGIEIHSGKNRVVRRIFEHLGYTVAKLDRVIFAGLTKKDLPRGHYRHLTEDEINFLRMV